ncbi:MAG: anti-sigma factor antagonist [Thermoleophilia bacterium]|nr:anti-sigma factor antagonist [Thermoleophilia bacterium]MDH3725043.1 anti-sigma factor antagonist [Thermoleophilia bacterium]
MGLDLTTKHRGDATIVGLAGELDIYTVPIFRNALDAQERAPQRLILDLTDLTLLDSSGLGALVSTLNRTREGHGELGLVCPQRHIRRIFEITGLRRAFVFGDDVAAVSAALDDQAANPTS